MRRFLIAMAAFVLAGCGGDRSVQGGGATETGNGLRLTIVSDQGRPAAFARAKIVRTDTWVRDLSETGSPRFTSAIADADGILRVDSLPEGEWAVQCDWGSQGAIRPLTLDTNSRHLKLRTLSRVRRNLSGPRVERLWVLGSAWNEGVDDAGVSDLYLPPGSHAIVARKDSSVVALGIAKVESWVSSSETFQVVDDRVVLDDFTGNDRRTTFWNYSGFGNWYEVGDKATTTLMRLDSGKMTLDYSISGTGGYALAGISFVTNSVYHPMDLSGMDSLCFDARGDGDLALTFHRVLPDGSIDLSATANLGLLGAAWSRRCLTPASFGADWSVVRSVGNDFAFVATKGARFQLRDIVLWGVPLQTLVR